MDLISNGGEASEPDEDEPGDGAGAAVDGGGARARAEELGPVVDGEASGDRPAARAEALDAFVLLRPALDGGESQGSDDVVQSDHTRDRADFVDADGHVRLLVAEELQESIEARSIGDVVGARRELAEIEGLSRAGGEDPQGLADLCESEDAGVGGSVAYGEHGATGGSGGFDDVVGVGLGVDPCHVAAGRHHVANPQLIQTDDVAEKAVVVAPDEAFGAGGLEQGLELFGAEGGGLLPWDDQTRQRSDDAGVEYDEQWAEGPGRHEDQRGEERGERDAVGVGEQLGDDLSQQDDREERADTDDDAQSGGMGAGCENRGEHEEHHVDRGVEDEDCDERAARPRHDTGGGGEGGGVVALQGGAIGLAESEECGLGRGAGPRDHQKDRHEGEQNEFNHVRPPAACAMNGRCNGSCAGVRSGAWRLRPDFASGVVGGIELLDEAFDVAPRVELDPDGP